MLPVAAALEDLGVAQGLGTAKELQATRALTAFSRLQLVARLGLPRIEQAYGLVGPCGGHARLDFSSSLRNWVMRALYRGSRFAQVRLFTRLALPSPQADPWHVAVACLRTGAEGVGRGAFRASVGSLDQGWPACQLQAAACTVAAVRPRFGPAAAAAAASACSRVAGLWMSSGRRGLPGGAAARLSH